MKTRHFFAIAYFLSILVLLLPQQAKSQSQGLKAAEVSCNEKFTELKKGGIAFSDKKFQWTEIPAAFTNWEVSDSPRVNNNYLQFKVDIPGVIYLMVSSADLNKMKSERWIMEGKCIVQANKPEEFFIVAKFLSKGNHSTELLRTTGLRLVRKIK